MMGVMCRDWGLLTSRAVWVVRARKGSLAQLRRTRVSGSANDGMSIGGKTHVGVNI
jgi:hypothetical protein